MLPRGHRLRRSTEFDLVVRRGMRVPARSVVVHAYRRDDNDPVRVGFVVSRAVGNAATRNRVKRRLRSLMAARLAGVSAATSLVIRAQPSAAQRDFQELGADLDTGLHAVAASRMTR